MTPSPDRYAPPRANVMDLAAADTLLAARPRTVVWACGLLLASLVIGFIALLPVVDLPMPDEPVAMTAMIWGFTLVFTGLELWLLRCVWRRRNWARWVMVALKLLGLAISVQVIAEDWSRAPLVAWLSITSNVASAIAAVLLLARPAARWFKGRPHTH
jgi:hypothetical protein